MAAQPKEWLVRKAKKHYVGPFDSDTIKRMIKESELSAYDEISRTAQLWGYLKDCPPFIQTLEQIVPHMGDEKTVTLASDEVTNIIHPGERPNVIPSKSPFRKEAVIDLKKKPEPSLGEPPRASKQNWRGFVFFFIVIAVAIWWWMPKDAVVVTQTPEPIEEDVEIQDPKLKALSETFRKFNLLFYQGQLEEQAGNTLEAIEIYQKALEFKPADHKVRARLLALRMQDSKDLMQIRTQYLKILVSSTLEASDRAMIQNYLGILELKEEDYGKAIIHLKQAVTHDSKFAPAHFNLGYAYFFLKQYYNARRHFDQAVRLQPSFPLIYLYLGRTLQKLNKNKEAIQEFINANRINPNAQLPYLYLSFIHFKLKNQKKAYSYLEQMIRRDPGYDEDSYKDLRYMQERLSYGFILKTYSIILGRKKQSSTVNAGLGLLYYLDGQTEKGKKIARASIKSDQKNSTAHTIYGYMLQKEGLLQEALGHLLTSIRYDYQNSFTHILIADINLRLGRYQKAIEHCRKVFSFDPFYVRSYYTLGKGLVSLDRLSEANKAFNKALEYDPNYMPAKRMLQQYSK